MSDSFRVVLLLGGQGSRLRPCTYFVNKHFIPLGDLPMFFFPLATALLTEPEEVVLVVNPFDEAVIKKFCSHLNKVRSWGFDVRFHVRVQKIASGIADGLYVGAADFDGNVLLMLGDNFFSIPGAKAFWVDCYAAFVASSGSRVISCFKKDPTEFGVFLVNELEQVCGVVEKPRSVISNFVQTGAWFFDKSWSIAYSNTEPSSRGEMEISDVVAWYISRKECSLAMLPELANWADCGRFGDLNDVNANLVNRFYFNNPELDKIINLLKSVN